MSLSRDEYLLEQYLAGDASAEELHEFEQRLAADGTLRARLVQAAAIDAQLAKLEFGEVTQQRRWVWPAAAAIAAMVLLAAGVLFMVKQREEPGQQGQPPALAYDQTHRATNASSVMLNDRAEVLLAQDAAIKRVRPTGAIQEQVTLETGRAEFRVRHEPGAFRVDTAHGSIATLGTTFLVRTEPGATLVAVTEGRVQARRPGVNEGGKIIERGHLEQLAWGERERPVVVSARCERVDAASGYVLLARSEGRDGNSFRVAADAIILIDRRAGTFADIKPGQMLKMFLNNAGDAMGVVARGGALQGTVVDVNLKHGTVTLQQGKEQSRQVALHVPADAVLKVNGHLAALKDLPIGKTAQVQLTVDGAGVYELAIGHGEGEGRR